MSQAIDGQLSPEQAEHLDRLLAADPQAKAEFDRMRRLDELLGQWSRKTAPVDTERLEDSLTRRVHEDAEFAISRMFDGDPDAQEELAAFGRRNPHIGLLEHKYRRLELLLRGWASLEVPVDPVRLHARLCETIHAEANRRRRGRMVNRVIRLYTPLAMAASVVLIAGLWGFGRGGTPPPPSGASGTVAKSSGPARIEVAWVGPRAPAEKGRPVMEFKFGVAPDAPIQAARVGEGGGSGAILSFGGPASASAAPGWSSDEGIF